MYIISHIPTLSPAGLLIFSTPSREGSLFPPAHALLDPDFFWVCIPGIPRPAAAWQGTHLSPRGIQSSTAAECQRSPPYLSPEVGPSPCWGPQILCIVLPDQCRADVRLYRQCWKGECVSPVKQWGDYRRGGSILYLLSALATLDSELPLPPVPGPAPTPICVSHLLSREEADP